MLKSECALDGMIDAASVFSFEHQDGAGEWPPPRPGRDQAAWLARANALDIAA